MNQIWLWSASVAICTHFDVWFGPNQPWSSSFLTNIGCQLDRKCCGWLKITCMILISGFIIVTCEPMLTLECFYSCLQPCAHVIWARVAPSLVIFYQIWGSAWPWMVCLDEKYMYGHHPKLCRPFLWTRFDFGVLLQQSETMRRCNLGPISSGAACFWPKLGVSLEENLVVDLIYHVRFPSQAL